jgi:hypothetical protein
LVSPIKEHKPLFF